MNGSLKASSFEPPSNNIPSRMNCSLHQVFGAGAFLRLEKTKQEQITCVTSTLTKSTQI